MNEERKWHVLLTKVGCEDNVCKALSAIKTHHIHPSIAIAAHSTGTRYQKKYSLFPRFVFVFVSESEAMKLLKVKGVAGLLYWLAQPAIIPNEEIQAIINSTRVYKQIAVEKVKAKPNGLISTTLRKEGSIDTVVILAKKYACKILLPSLGYALIVKDMFEIYFGNPLTQINVISPTITPKYRSI